MNSDNIIIARPKDSAGSGFVAPKATTPPTDASSSLPSAFKGLGWLGADGIKMVINRETTGLDAFGGDEVIKIQTKHSVQFVFKPLETLNKVVLTELLGDGNVDADGDTPTAARVTSDELSERVWVFDCRIRNGMLCRVVLPKGAITAEGEMALKSDDAFASELTVDAYSDADGVKAYIYFATAATASGE